MQCRRCGKEIGNYTRCSFCGYENLEGNVREMTSTEKIFYDGVTIDSDETANQNSYRSNYYRQKSNYNPNYTYSRKTTFYTTKSTVLSRILGRLFVGLFNNELLAKIAVTLITLAIAALLFFVALPIVFLILAIGIAMFVVSKLGR